MRHRERLLHQWKVIGCETGFLARRVRAGRTQVTPCGGKHLARLGFPYHHAAAAGRLPESGQSALVGPGAAGRVVSVRKETSDSATLEIKPGWGFHFDYHPGQYVGIGVLIDAAGAGAPTADVSAGDERLARRTPGPACRRFGAHHHHHRQGDARRIPLDPPGQRPGAGHDRAPRRPAGKLRARRSGTARDPVPHRGKRHHPDHVDAAYLGAALGRGGLAAA